MATSKPKRDAKYQADLMVESFGAKRAYDTAVEMIERSGGKNLEYWHAVRNSINYTPPPKERTPAELAYDRLVAWATEQDVEFTRNPYAFSITVYAGSPKFHE